MIAVGATAVELTVFSVFLTVAGHRFSALGAFQHTVENALGDEVDLLVPLFKHTLYWGIASVAFVKLLHPKIDSIVQNFNLRTVRVLLIIIFAVFFLDVANSVRKALDIRKLQDKLSKILESVSAAFSNVKTTLEDKKTSLQLSIENKSDRFYDTRIEAFEELQEIIQEFELRFSKGKSDKADRKKYSNRFFRNNFSIEINMKKQLERIRKLRDDIKSNLFEDGEKQ